MRKVIFANVMLALFLICATAWAASKLRVVSLQIGGNTVLTGALGNSGIIQQAGTISGTGLLCADANGNTTTVNCQSANLFSATTLGGDVGFSASTPTTVMTRALTMPSAGCPCRVMMSYSAWINTGSSGVGYTTWVTDGTNTMATYSSGQSNGSSGAAIGMSRAILSPVTYANSANVTFTLTVQSDHSGTVKAAAISGGPNSDFQVSVVQSN